MEGLMDIAHPVERVILGKRYKAIPLSYLVLSREEDANYYFKQAIWDYEDSAMSIGLLGFVESELWVSDYEYESEKLSDYAPHVHKPVLHDYRKHHKTDRNVLYHLIKNKNSIRG